MSASFRHHIEQESLRAMLLAFGIEHAYRVISLEEITHEIPYARKHEVQGLLEDLAREGLVTKFSGRYCFNKAIPMELRHSIERLVTPSGTIRKRAS